MNLKDTYNKIAEAWYSDHSSDDWWQEGTNMFISFVKPGGMVLDIGCGGGTKSKYLADKGLKITGIDFSENLLAIAQKEVPKGEFLLMDLNDIDKLNNAYDGIFMQAVLLHVPKNQVEVVLKKVIERLNVGGYLYVAVKEKVEGGIDEEVKRENDYGYEYERFFSYFTVQEFENWFKHLGLEVVYKDVKPPTKSSGKSNWIQIIAKKN